MTMPDVLARRREVRSKARHGRWYQISNQAGPTAEVRIYDEVSFWGLTAEDFARELDTITAPEIVVAINCPGGDVFDCIAIYNALRTHPARVTTRVDGIAASGASVIAQAGVVRQVMGGGQVMIHEPWGIEVGSAEDHRAFADLLDRQTEVLASIYATRSGRDEADFLELLRTGKDVWMTAAEAVGAGLADEVIEPDDKTGPAQANARARLIDELSEAVDAVTGALESAERVAALRAERGKRLSGAVRTGLGELVATADRLRALLDPQDDPPTTQDDARAEIDRELARFVRISQGV